MGGALITHLWQSDVTFDDFTVVKLGQIVYSLNVIPECFLP